MPARGGKRVSQKNIKRFVATDNIASIVQSFTRRSDGGVSLFAPDEFAPRRQTGSKAFHDAALASLMAGREPS